MSYVRQPRDRRAERTRQEEPLPFLTEENQPLLATNTGVRLACTMAAMLGVFAIFLCWAEKESRVIRRFAVQSATLTALHLCGGAVLGVISLVVGQVPYLGFLMTLLGWLIYIAVAIMVLFLRIKLMEHAWHGRRFELPLLEGLIRRFYLHDTNEEERYAA
ncbi:MAG: hypothetical protein ACI4WX_04635 [Aristaeellaceae bacterium]